MAKKYLFRCNEGQCNQRGFETEHGLAVHRGKMHGWKAYDMPALTAEMLGLDKDVSYGRVELPVQPEGSMRDMVNHPPHYLTGGIECIEAIRASMSGIQYRGYTKGCVMKYLWRWEHKGGVEDLKKAQWYLTELIRATGEPDSGTN